MALNLIPLDPTRSLMADELDLDIECDCLVCSSRLTLEGCEKYPELLKDAVLNHSEAALEATLKDGWLVDAEPCTRSRLGWRKVNQNSAAKMLAEGSWNNLFCRAQCRLAIADGSDLVEVFRAVERNEPRSQSEELIGSHIDAHQLLEDLRGSACEPGNSHFGVPGGPNSGISVVAVPSVSAEKV